MSRRHIARMRPAIGTLTDGQTTYGPIFQKWERADRFPADPREISAARNLVDEIGGDILLTQTPSIFSCQQRVHEIADALGAPFFAPDPLGYSTTDGGGHLDGISSARYSAELFAWMEKTDQFQRLVEAPPHRTLAATPSK